MTDIQAIESLIATGDIGKLTPQQRVEYYHALCAATGLNPVAQPFEYLQLQGKTVLYAKRAATEQLRAVHKISVTIVSRETSADVHSVVARAATPDGRCDESVGAVYVGGLKGEALSNALMKAETKAKRRVTLSMCGLGLLDESEVSSVPNARVLSVTDGHTDSPVIAQSSSLQSADAAIALAEIQQAATLDELAALAPRLSALAPKSSATRGEVVAAYKARETALRTVAAPEDDGR